MGKLKDISNWLASNVRKIRSNQKNTVLSILFILFVCHMIFIVSFQTGWVATTLNDEIGIESLPSYEDSNTTMQVRPVEKSYGSYYSNDPVDSEIITSEYGAEIEIRYIQWPICLNICYMEVLVSNGTPSADLDGWSLNVTTGNQSGTSWHWPVSVVIPIHEPTTEITFQIHLLSTDFNKTYPTLTAMNNMNFTYTVYYKNSEITADSNVRILVDSNSKIIGILTLVTIGLLYKLPEREIVKYDKSKTMTKKSKSEESNLISFFSGRIDNVDRDRHYLAIETQILIVILATIASYTINSDFGLYFALAIIILAFPLVLSVIALVAGIRSESSECIHSLDSDQIICFLRAELLRKEQFMRQVKNLIFGGSLYAIAFVLVMIFPPISEYHFNAAYATMVTTILLFLALLVLASMHAYRKLFRIEKSFPENSKDND